MKKKNIAACLTNFPFVVVFDHEPVYGGLFLIDAPWPQAFYFPVMYVYLKGNQVEFAIRPSHTVSKKYSEDEWEVIMDERIRQLFADEETLE